ncbi:putative membrane protein [Streptosporangium becharense]|uniref:Putative membrane protein n=1 Tax=Streptosporangium becharense TaxID=1816182 RepID=A0A7W9MHR4_9ACTN|nr:DUF2079 domain-containing protein [Streptosporangium becharense]MBB2913926.1 putative membrane protein [Streptosporangium becharense]MBB5821412.1 putative membrane protein [Streptosporangium becharense]
MAYVILGLVEFHTLRTGVYDLVIFDQGVRGYANFGLPTSFVKGNWQQLGSAFPLLGDHFSPILALLAPLYWIHDGPETLVVAQAGVLALAVLPFWVYTRRALGTRAAYLLGVAYLLSWPVAETVDFHFHEYAFVPLITAVLFERMQAGRRWHALAAAVVLLLVKEDLSLFVVGLGAGLLLVREWRRTGALMILGGAGFLWLAGYVIIPAFGGTPGRYWYYSGWGEDLGEAVARIVTHPHEVLGVLSTPDTKVWTVLLLFAPLFFLPLLSPYAMAPAALLAERMLATDPGAAGWWGTRYHYNAAVVMALFCAAVDGAARLRRMTEGRRFHWSVPSWAPAVAVTAAVIMPFFALGNLFTPSWYGAGPRHAAAVEAMRRVPDGVLVEAANALGPGISARTRVVAWAAKTAARPERAPWILADLRARQPHFDSVEDQAEDVGLLRQRGYRDVFSQDGYVVLCNPSVDEACG